MVCKYCLKKFPFSKNIDEAIINPNGTRFTYKTIDNLEIILHLYHHENITIFDISKILQMSKLTISKILVEFGISHPVTTKLTIYDEKEINITYNLLKNTPNYIKDPSLLIRNLAREYKVKTSTIKSILHSDN
ncbi:MarR family transcriptional regulator [Cytobacillus sp. Sa5YUA1]|uniref:MarR family transcriptional regulator n=1 Tax=Cytobacillus stercorigallinarum TaxID=2762240 RepID=A0ABR8QLM4_9BACI|nr:helix-turn-helix domain-containing protein [Cytobacillus stercorigallinarum]MBD7936422.1 MarR family transcriptional regulator [Cytobacillus stercorigallinarum]